MYVVRYHLSVQLKYCQLNTIILISFAYIHVATKPEVNNYAYVFSWLISFTSNRMIP